MERQETTPLHHDKFSRKYPSILFMELATHKAVKPSGTLNKFLVDIFLGVGGVFCVKPKLSELSAL